MDWNPGDAILSVLTTAEPEAKAAAATEAAALTAAHRPGVPLKPWPPAPGRPARPARPELVPPGRAPRRRTGSRAGRAALLHALAHIEFNAIDLAFDIALRFAPSLAVEGLDAAAFLRDWTRIGAEEAKHFLMVCERLSAVGSAYGDLPAHDGLWKTAERTSDDVLARLAAGPMALEARGLDVTPGLAEKLSRAGDPESADVLGTIYRDEIGHVSAGVFWFETICARRGLQPMPTFRRLVAERLIGGLRPPFNEAGRKAAGLDAGFYVSP